MKAIIYEKYGGPEVLELKEIEAPVVKENDVLVRVRAASVNPYDWHFVRGKPYFMRLMIGLLTPKEHRVGADLAGHVEAVGKNVSRFRPGDEVFGTSTGAFAEYVCGSEDQLEAKPSNLTFEQAATVPIAGLTALQGLRDWGRMQPGQKVLIIGASGGVGTFAVQIAKSLGALVTGVCSTRNIELVQSIGADHVIDYTQEDFTRSGQRYDLIFQLAGTHSPSHCRRALAPKGTLVLTSGEGGGWNGPLGRVMKALVLSPFVSQKMVMRVAKIDIEDLRVLKALLEAGKVTPVIDRTYNKLNEVPDALRYLEEGHARGKVVIAVGSS